MMKSTGRTLIILLLFGITWYTLQGVAGTSRIPIKKSLHLFPKTIGNYSLSSTQQSPAEVLEMLGVDDYIQYTYVGDDGFRVNFYVGYYGAVGVTGSYHSPKNCLPGGGWGIKSGREISVAGIAGQRQVNISEMLIQNGTEQQLVMYWYQNRGRIIASEYMEKVYLVLDAIQSGRRDGAFIRLMANVKNRNTVETEAQLLKFVEQIIPVLQGYLPGEKL